MHLKWIWNNWRHSCQRWKPYLCHHSVKIFKLCKFYRSMAHLTLLRQMIQSIFSGIFLGLPKAYTAEGGLHGRHFQEGKFHWSQHFPSYETGIRP